MSHPWTTVAAELLDAARPAERSATLQIGAAATAALLDIAGAIRDFTEAYQRRTSLDALGRRR